MNIMYSFVLNVSNCIGAMIAIHIIISIFTCVFLGIVIDSSMDPTKRKAKNVLKYTIQYSIITLLLLLITLLLKPDFTTYTNTEAIQWTYGDIKNYMIIYIIIITIYSSCVMRIVNQIHKIQKDENNGK